MADAKSSSRSSRPPWKKRNPRKKSTKLSQASKEAAKSRAAKAGRAYPNLVDNMWAAARQKKTKKGESA